jgi:hypothetical protein
LFCPYCKALKKRPTSQVARQVLEELRQDFDRAGASGRKLLVTLDGSFCNQVFFQKAFDRVELLCRCRKDAVLCLAAQDGSPRRFYSQSCFTPESLRQDEAIPWQEGEFFGEHFKTGADSDGPSLIKYWGAHLPSVFSDFHCGQRNDKPLTSLTSPRFERLSSCGGQHFAFAHPI